MTAPAALGERAADLVTLAKAVAGAPTDHEAAPGFTAWLGGEAFEVTAVLERTAVLDPSGDRWGERRTARLDQLVVDPAAIRWRPKASSHRLGIRPFRTADVAGEPATPRAAAPPEPATAVPLEQRQQVDDQVGDAPETGAERRDCGRCGGELPAHNQRGLCLRCQRRCPTCGGPKSIPAPRCRRCRRQPEAEAEPELPTVASRALDELPVRIRELCDQVVVLARYARALEDELDHTRAELRRLEERVAGALTRSNA